MGVKVVTEKKEKRGKSSRRTFLLSGILAAVGALGAYIHRKPLTSLARGFHTRYIDTRPNIIMVLMDTLRADHLGCYGYQRPISKNIDRFSRDGVLFQNTMAQSNWTLPSISSLFTSLFPHQHAAGLPIKDDVMRSPLPDSFTTLAEVLSEVGYYTMAVTGGAYVSTEANMDRGFREFHEISSKHDYDKGYLANDLPLQLRKATELVLDHYKRDKFFLFIHSYECHNPLIPPQKLVDYLDPHYDGPPVTGNIFADLRSIGQKNPHPLGLERIKTLYDAEIMFSDHLLGLFFKMLEEVGIYDDVLIIFLSDHGVEYYEHGGWRHGLRNLFEELVRIPIIFKYPKGRMKGVDTDRLARLIDIMPTILIDVLGLPDTLVPMEGVPLSRPVGESMSISEAMMSVEELGLFARRIGDIKYIVSNEKGTGSAYDLRVDPTEGNDVALSYSGELEEAVAYAGRAEELFLRNLSEYQSGVEVKIDEKNFQTLRDLGYLE
jgi:arylsulfatase A-like enzyme